MVLTGLEKCTERMEEAGERERGGKPPALIDRSSPDSDEPLGTEEPTVAAALEGGRNGAGAAIEPVFAENEARERGTDEECC